MKDPEDSHREDRESDDEDDTDPVPAEPDRPSLWQWPVVRGVANGALFAVMLSVIQVYGLFREARAARRRVAGRQHRPPAWCSASSCTSSSCGAGIAGRNRAVPGRPGPTATRPPPRPARRTVERPA